MTTETGTHAIMEKQRRLVRSFWPYAVHYELPILAWWTYPLGLKRLPTGNRGLSGQSFGMRNTGYKRREGPMLPQVARGFLTLLLSKEQRRWLTETEEKAGRYLTPYEVYRKYPSLEKKTVPPEHENAMVDCWTEFFKNHTGRPWMEVKDQWDDWVLRNYVEPLPQLSASKSAWDEQ